MMAAAAWGPGDIDPGLSEIFRCASDLLGQVRRGGRAMSGGHWRGGPWERKSGGRKGPGHWGGGFGGAWGGWGPGPPGPPGPARRPQTGRRGGRSRGRGSAPEGARHG